ncbi:MAG TPA: hypothetical protein VMS21_13230 [Methylomirabilota bacterium]|nr:hypothetical protein [Methylomirabilota bacterium]
MRLPSYLTALSLTVMLTACSKDSQSGGPGSELITAPPKNTSEAADQMEAVFAEAPPQVKANAVDASQALKTKDYEQAVIIVHALQTQENLTHEQGLAARNTMVTLQKDLIRAMEAGDTNAQKAFERLRELHRN